MVPRLETAATAVPAPLHLLSWTRRDAHTRKPEPTTTGVTRAHHPFGKSPARPTGEPIDGKRTTTSRLATLPSCTFEFIGACSNIHKKKKEKKRDSAVGATGFFGASTPFFSTFLSPPRSLSWSRHLPACFHPPRHVHANYYTNFSFVPLFMLSFFFLIFLSNFLSKKRKVEIGVRCVNRARRRVQLKRVLNKGCFMVLFVGSLYVSN